MLDYEQDAPFRSWMMGARFADSPREPVTASVRPGYSGLMAELWSSPVPLMPARLLSTLRAAGVDNVDTYRAEVRDPASGAIHRGYVAFNIVGAVAAADLGRSQFDPDQPDRNISMIFDAVTIDRGAAMDLLMFRLAESVNAIMIHERVKRFIVSSGIASLTFIEPEDWAG